MTFVQSESIQVSCSEFRRFADVHNYCEVIRTKSKDPDTRELASKIVPLLHQLMAELTIDFDKEEDE